MIEPGPIDRATWAVVGGRPTAAGAPTNHPITPASTFRAGGAHWYARNDGTESVDAFEAVMAGLEGGPTIAYASGMAAAAAVIDLVPVGGSIALPSDCYHGVVALAEQGVAHGRWSVQRVSPTDTAGWMEAVQRVDLAWIETPSNPMLEVCDVPAITAVEGRAGLVTVDSTLATPLGASHLSDGADIVMHSASKFIGGHSDLLIGTLSVTTSALEARLRTGRRLGGGFPGALEVFLALRGLRTLPLRYERSSESAGLLASRLAGHPAVLDVRYPGTGAMISFQAAGGDHGADSVIRSLGIISHATSLGGVETSLERRSGQGPGTEHLPPGLIRMSVGIEMVEDLWRDLSSALAEGRDV